MITINLLPDEYRARAKSPVGMIAAVAAAVFLNASLIAYYGYLEFGTSKSIKTNRDVLQLDLDGLKPQVKYHNDLEKEVNTRSAREETLAEITGNRVLWTKVIDELVDVIHSGREGIEHFIWFEDLDVNMAANGARGDFGKLKARARSGSDTFAPVTTFQDAVEDRELSALMDTFKKPEAPTGRINEPDEDLIPAVNWSFNLEMFLLDPPTRVANYVRSKESKQ